MMGPRTGQRDRLFYEFNIEDRIPAGHLLRRIDAVVPSVYSIRLKILRFSRIILSSMHGLYREHF